MSLDSLISLSYLLAAVLFIIGLKRLQSPETARGGNAIAAVGMLLAVLGTLLQREILDFTWILVGIVAGSGLGLVMAQRVPMTAMPQMVGAFNGFGGAASALVSAAEFLKVVRGEIVMDTDLGVSIMAGTLIGWVTFSGSMIAFGKLQGLVTERAWELPGQQIVSSLLGLGALGAAVYVVAVGGAEAVYLGLIGISLVIGVLVVIRIGGADMPVVIALLNSYSGLAASAAGFVLGNMALIISGALVGASGLILTSIMCRAMNRSLANVLFGAFGAGSTAATRRAETGEKVATEIDAEDAAMLLGYASQVIFVPGYGLAVAQAQHRLRELADLLAERGVNVRFAIHPVAGRMPGHMNVLLAEANVPYDQLYEPEDVNPEMQNVDAAVVVGANDVVNPTARDDPTSPIAGMPIIEVDRAKTSIVIKRSLSPGYAGIDNPLFYKPNNRMLFGDAAQKLGQLIEEVKEL
ncbi:MAG: NAD(P)(+) transhydrogenase (Re/Si-specific) subunit beta [Gemmatimonadota bacterium]